jgi:LytS/YehU family sensor histidine kinase
MPAHPRIDWSQLWYPGRKHPFTPDEMARAGGHGPSATLWVLAVFNFCVPGGVLLQLSPPAVVPWLAGVLAWLFVVGGLAARWLWWQPWRRPLWLASQGVVLAMLMLALSTRWALPAAEERRAVGVVVIVGAALLVMALWLLVAWRSQEIEARLREQAERARAVEMARRLAAAQLEPHFLFNTLASVQHWVQTRDERAGPLLASLTGYLRATLPLFDRPRLRVGDELVAVQRYLEVMQARLGTRLAWQMDVPAVLHGALLPPGLLLTLVENAVVHGIEPALNGGRVMVAGRREGAAVVFEVQDDGPGLPADLREGLGLTNVRQSLQLAFGDAGRLNLAPAPGGGCRSELRTPFEENPP